MTTDPTKQSEFVGYIDSAEIIPTPSGHRYLRVIGWIVHVTYTIKKLEIALPNEKTVNAELCHRPDVSKWLPHISHADQGGFVARIPLADNFKGTDTTFTTQIILSNGERITCPLPAKIKTLQAAFTTPPLDSHEAYAPESAHKTLDGLWNVLYQSFQQSRERLLFEQVENPLVSIILVTHNQAHLTYNCLRSILDQQSVGLEVIIIDNGSSDSTHALLSRVHGIRTVKNPINMHFIEGANQGASAARGEFLLFLNNDLQLLPGAIAGALNAFRNEIRVGAVGGKLIRPDGKLQEAGSILYADGSSSGRFVGSDPFTHQIRQREEVDYCSGAFLMTPRALFSDMRMFDASYKPAYYEDVDYCVRLREYGYKTFFEPSAAALHLQHGSSDSKRSAQQLMAKNKLLFAKRHASYLATKGRSSADSITSMIPKRILFIDDCVPTFENGQGQPRTLRILEVFQEKHIPVTFAALNEKQGSEAERKQVPGISEIRVFDQEELHQFIRDAVTRFTHIFVSRPTNMEILAEIREKEPHLFRSVKIIYDAEAVFALRDIRRKELQTGLTFSEEEVRHIISLETRLAASADCIVAVSDNEFMRFSEGGFHHIFKLSHAVSPEAPTVGFDQRKGIISLGPLLSAESPNVDAVQYFVNDILPFISHSIIQDGVRFGGSLSTLTLPTHPFVSYPGLIHDLKSFYSSSRVFVAPTRFAAGIPLKVIEAVAAGIPCVVSELIADQLNWKDGVECLVGHSAEEFAKKINMLYTDQNVWEHIQGTGLARVQRDFSKDRFHSAVEDIFKFID